MTERNKLLERPFSAGAEITNICNANCSFCGYGKGSDGKAADPRVKSKQDISAYKHLLKIYSEAGGGNFSITPILGEVSVHPEWLKLVKLAKSYKNITGVSCFSNGILLHRHGFENILKSGLSAFTISTALGSREQYKRLYGKDLYHQVKSNILELLKKNKELKYPVAIHLALRMDKPYDKFLKSEFYKEILNYIKKENISILEGWDDFRGIIKKKGLPKGQVFRTNLWENERKNTPCYALYRKLEILNDGTIQGCTCRVEPELWGGNIKNYKSLNEAWNDKTINKIRNNWFNGKLSECCKTCSHYEPYTSHLRRNKRNNSLLRRMKDKIFRNFLQKVAIKRISSK